MYSVLYANIRSVGTCSYSLVFIFCICCWQVVVLLQDHLDDADNSFTALLTKSASLSKEVCVKG